MKPSTEWVLLCMYDPAEGEPDVSEEALVRRAHDTIGDTAVDVRIKSVGKWQINHVVATEYRRGRVFLAGDPVDPAMDLLTALRHVLSLNPPSETEQPR